MLLLSAQFNDLDEIIKYLRDRDYFDLVIYHTSSRLKKIVLITQKESINFKKICWTLKKNFLVTKNFF